MTRSPIDRELARRSFRQLVNFGPEALSSVDAQMHTHTVSAPLGRWAIYYDWLCDEQLFSPSEHQRIRQTMLEQAYLLGAQQLSGRIRRFDNQVLSNAFGVAAVGYVLGVRRDCSALGQELLRHALHWLSELLRLMPTDGNSAEGSTYQEHVVLPGVLFGALLVEQITGQPVMERGIAPDGPPARRVLEVCHKLIGPAGLLPGWDDWGFQHASVKAGLVYLARLTGDPAPVSLLHELGLWDRHAMPAWERDDRLWSLVWWPTELNAAGGRAPATSSQPCARKRQSISPAFEPWMAPTFGGALQHPRGRVRLFQCWGLCGGITAAGRANTDPKAITLEAFGSPVLVDGHGTLPSALRSFDPAELLAYAGEHRLATVQAYARGSQGSPLADDAALARLVAGSIGQASALVFDDEAWYVPLEPCLGQGEALHHVGPMQVLRSEAAALYQARYDVDRVERSSVLIDGTYVLVTDRVEARSPHRVTWQAFARPEVTREADRAVVRTAEQVRCDIVPLQPGPIRLDEAEGYPRMPEGHSVRIQHDQPPAKAHRIDVAMVPQSRLRPWVDVTAGWRRQIGDRDAAGRSRPNSDVISLDEAMRTDPLTEPRAPRHYRRRVMLDPAPGSRYFLELAVANRAVRLWVNDQPIEPVLHQRRGIWQESVCDLPWFFDVTEALRAGENELHLAAPLFHGEALSGPARLHESVEPPAVTAERLGPARFRVRFGEVDDELLCDNREPNATWAGGTTDARYAVRRADGTPAAAAVTRIELPGGCRFIAALLVTWRGPRRQRSWASWSRVRRWT